MDVTGWLLRLGAGRPHVFVVTAVGGTGPRLAIEAEVARRGWPVALSPADADVLVVAGTPGPQLSPVLDRIWTQVPAPRTLVRIEAASAAGTQLDTAMALLADGTRQRAGARRVPESIAGPAHPSGGPEDSAGHADSGGHGERMDSGARGGHGGHGAHAGHGGMETPGGLAMADLGPDRDGLTLDQLHVPLGPALPYWPAGLVLRLVMQGDVVRELDAEVLDAEVLDAVPGASFWDHDERAAAREFDALGRFLAVAGWADTAARAHRLRDELLGDTPVETVVDDAAALARRVRRSRTLRRLVRGIPAGGSDVWERVEQRLVAGEGAMTGSGQREPVYRPRVGELPELLVGAELAALRLAVAALDPDTDSPPAPVDGRHPAAHDGAADGSTPHGRSSGAAARNAL